MKYKGIIFDFNGVLLWDTHLHEAAWRDFSRRIRGFAFSAEELADHVHGRTNRSVFEYLLNQSITSEEVYIYSRQKESLYQQLCLHHPEEFKLSPGAIELLDQLMQSGIPYTIATASDENNLQFFTQNLKLDQWFNLSKIVYDNGSYSGKMEMFVQAAKQINLLPEECMVIEDSQSGLIAASKAKIGKIVALGPKEFHNRLLSFAGVNAAITSLAQIECPSLILRE